MVLTPECTACALPILLWLGTGQESIGQGGSVEEQWGGVGGKMQQGGGANMICVPVVVYGRGPEVLGLKQPI